MSQDEFTNLFKYLSGRFDTLDTALEQKANKADVQNILNYLDAL